MQLSSPPSRPEDGLHLPERANVLTRLRIGYRALRILEKKPDDSVAAPVLNASIDGEVFERQVATLGQTADGREILSTRPCMRDGADLTVLAAMPDGTLGRALARYYQDNGILPFETPYPTHKDVDYLIKRYRETHDLVHVLTDYGTDALGEMELQAFAAGNLGLRTSVMILVFAAILMPHGLPPVWKYAGKLWAAYRRGRASKNILRPYYERYFSWSLDDARSAIELAPNPA
jgi:ubiquinone biosynthesis protein COQ4